MRQKYLPAEFAVHGRSHGRAAEIHEIALLVLLCHSHDDPLGLNVVVDASDSQ